MPVIPPLNDPDRRLVDFSDEYRGLPFKYELYVKFPQSDWTRLDESASLESLESQGDELLMRSDILDWLVKNHRGEVVTTALSKRAGLSPSWG